MTLRFTLLQKIMIWNFYKMQQTKMPAANMRFGATAAVAPRKRQCENERLSPA